MENSNPEEFNVEKNSDEPIQTMDVDKQNKSVEPNLNIFSISLLKEIRNDNKNEVPKSQSADNTYVEDDQKSLNDQSTSSRSQDQISETEKHCEENALKNDDKEIAAKTAENENKTDNALIDDSDDVSEDVSDPLVSRYPPNLRIYMHTKKKVKKSSDSIDLTDNSQSKNDEKQSTSRSGGLSRQDSAKPRRFDNLIGSNFLADFNPETSTREKKKLRRKNFQFNNTNNKKNFYHDGQGRFSLSGDNMCDCLHLNCPGCFFECPNCGSPKCGPTCRVQRKWTIEYVKYDGKDLKVKNPILNRMFDLD